MRTNTPAHDAPRYLCKIDNDAWLRRFIFWAFRKLVLNEDHYKLIIRYTGPRPRGTPQGATRKENATARRYYLEPRYTPPRQWASVRSINEAEAMRRPYR